MTRAEGSADIASFDDSAEPASTRTAASLDFVQGRFGHEGGFAADLGEAAHFFLVSGDETKVKGERGFAGDFTEFTAQQRIAADQRDEVSQCGPPAQGGAAEGRGVRSGGSIRRCESARR